MLLLTVIIPTHKRPQFLPRAIESALQASPNGDVEVIVVPNGPDTSWQAIAEQFKSEPRVKWHPIEKAHANAARNHGMKLAQGKYIRFLDDDDFFYPEAAQKQLEKLIELDADISCGRITKTDEAGNILEIAQQLDTDDFIEAAIGRGHSTATCALVIKSEAAAGCSWDESVNKNQDVYWAWELCKKQELSSFRFRRPVAAWVQHAIGLRISQGHHRGEVAKLNATYLLDVLETLNKRGTLNQQRKEAIANLLWDFVHSGIMFSPIFWLSVSRIAEELSKESHPSAKLYSYALTNYLNPFIIELSLVPWRWFKVLMGKKYTT